MKKYLKFICILLLVAIVQVYIFGTYIAKADTYICGYVPLNDGIVYDCDYHLNAGGTPGYYGYVLCSPYAGVICNVCGKNYATCSHEYDQTYGGTVCSPYSSTTLYCNICGLNYSNCSHLSGFTYGGTICSPSGGICNVCGRSYAICEHIQGRTYGGTVCSPYSVTVTICNICGGNYSTCSHGAGNTYGGTLCCPYSGSICNICGYGMPYCVHTPGQVYTVWIPGAPDTYHIHDYTCPYHYTTHTHTSSCPIDRSPTLSIQNISSNQLFDENSTPINPQITVSDDRSSLTCRMFIDNETQPRLTKTGNSGQTVTFDAINFGQLINGTHQIRFEVSDGCNSPTRQSVSIKVDRLSPESGNITATGDPSSITVQVSQAPVDSISGMSAAPYRYSIGSTVGEWTSSTSNTFTGLSPATEYNIKVDVRDNSGHIKTFEQVVSTRAQASTIAVSNVTKNSFDINVSDTNPTNTQYQIMVGTKYVNVNGRLSNTPKWISLTGKKIKVIGLSSATAYTISVVSKNIDDTVTTAAAGSVTTLN